MSKKQYTSYESEVKQKWANTQAYEEHQLKTKNYSHDKWNILMEEMENIFKSFSFYINKEEASSNIVQNLVIKLQKFITDNYYTCTNEILYGLGQMYISDERFKKNIDKNGEGTAKFVNEAIKIYCGK